MEIYLIQNLVNEKYYVGQTRYTTKDRWNSHLEDTKAGDQQPIHRAIRKYGKDKFSKTCLCYCDTLEELNKAEDFFIRLLGANKTPFGYNVSSGGQYGTYNDFTRQRMSLDKTAFWETKSQEERRAHMAPANQTPWDDERRLERSNDQREFLLSDANPFRGKEQSEEQRTNIADALISFYENNPQAIEDCSQRRKQHLATLSVEGLAQTTSAARSQLQTLRAQGIDPLTDEGRQILIDSQTASWAKLSPEQRLDRLKNAHSAPKVFSEEARKTCGEASRKSWTPERHIKHAAAMVIENERRRLAKLFKIRPVTSTKALRFI